MTLVYLDHNATTPLCSAAADAMARAREDGWGNPSSVHRAGRAARRYLDDARAEVAALAGVSDRDVVFTSGGTEANNLALRRIERGGTLVTSALEHPSVVATARAMEADGVTVVWLPVPADGRLLEAEVGAALRRAARPCLLSMHAAHHETGALQPVTELVALAHALGAEVHVDAVQAAGRVPPESWRGADSVALASHKLRGPKGIGALAHLPGKGPRPVLWGGPQERGLRPGTQDAIAAAGFGAAARRAREGGSARYQALAPLRDAAEAAALALGARRTTPAPRAPHVAHLLVDAISGDALVAALDLEGVCVSSGSACAAGTAEPSPAITAMLGADAAAHSLRVSLGETTTPEDIDAFAAALARVVARSLK
ncbi:MAG: aminotransferase class V-fold PLP-dependent enzyme [Polyangiaceae bacterium]|nr:aminotransferase class V-fold PLP-dependent enzyme [Polyangiaceae bacterium]